MISSLLLLRNMVKIIHYREPCIGCNACVEYAPEYWGISVEDGKATLKGAIKKKEVYVLEIHAWDSKKNEEAARACPMQIIRVIT